MVVNLASVLNAYSTEISRSDKIEIFNLLSEIDVANNVDCPNAYYFSERYSAYVNSTVKKYDPDMPNYWQAMSGDEAESWYDALITELENLIKRKTWTVVKIPEIGKSLPKGDVIPVTWVFKKKRHPDFSFLKYKGRLCVRGDLQRKQTDVESYAPVVSWTTIRLMLSLSCFLHLKTVCVDFSNAFAQADIPEGQHVYIKIPQGCEDRFPKNSCLKLNKSLYGQIDAPRLWYEKLKAGLLDRGFHQSKVDPCLFLSKKVIVICYVDDCLFFAKNKKDIDKLLASFKSDGDDYNWEMTVGGSVEEYLGIKIEAVKVEGQTAYKFTQPGLINKILQDTGMQNSNGKPTPTSNERPLGPELNSPPPKRDWNYASVIGMLLYLCNSMPEITFAVSQCARFTHSTRAAHEMAVLRICRYLQENKDKGLILKPSDTCNVDCYVDADFAGLYTVEDPDDPNCARSRAGFVLTVAGCPIVWKSKIIHEICLSTLHAEYVALSMAVREFLPLKQLVKEILGEYEFETDKIKFMTHSTIFEDNQGALTVAKSPKYTPTSKFIAVKYHWFRQYATGPMQEFELKYISSDKQRADLYTKGLQGKKFTDLRKLLCGW